MIYNMYIFFNFNIIVYLKYKLNIYILYYICIYVYMKYAIEILFVLKI